MYPPARGALEVNRNAVRPGQPVTARGCGFRPGSSVSFDFFSAPAHLGTAQADATGGVAATVTIPSDATPGDHTLEAAGVAPNGSARVLSAGIRVLGADQARGAGADGELPSTGSSSSAPLTAAGVGLVLLGTAAVYSARRRRAQRVTG